MRRVSRIVTLRIGAAGAAAAVALSAPALAGPAQAAPAPASASAAAVAASTTSAARARGAAGWLGRQFVDGNHLEVVFGGTAYPDAGLTLDAVLALAAAKVGNDEGGDAIRWLASGDQLATYIGDGTTESYAGPHAKVVLALDVRGRSPKRLAGRAVLAELKALQQPSGRFTDRSAFGDFSNAFSQSLAVIALERAGEATDAPADYLAGQACPDGGVPETLDAATCTSQVDATALAVQAFVATGRSAAAEKALAWLGTQQAADGGFGNSNSTGLAAAAFATGGWSAQARAAREYLGSLQQGCRAPLRTRGAIGYQPGPFDPATAVRATAQAVLGLAGANLGTLTSAGSRNRLPVLNCGGNP
jgi:hypothetical protein